VKFSLKNSRAKHPTKFRFLKRIRACLKEAFRARHLALSKSSNFRAGYGSDSSGRRTMRFLARQPKGMLVARFRTARHAVFVISDLTATENVTIAQKLSPAIRRHIEQSESGE
jgi:hypothetical protein